MIFNKITSTKIYPQHWKIEHGVAIPKVSPPESESDLRVISKTPFLSKLYESFISKWLLDIIMPFLDPSQCGLKGLSITHYLIRFLQFIHSSLDSYKPHAVIAAFIDMKKAFNRVDHNLLVQDLYDMHCSAWLLNIIISFLSDRKLSFAYKGNIARMMDLPGGAPQGCFLGAIIFIVKFNGALMRPSIQRPRLSLSKPSANRLKYFDDATVAVSLQLDSVLKSDPKTRERPFTFSERYQKVLPSKQNILQQQLKNMEKFSTKIRMIIDKEKTKAMKFTRVIKTDFPLEVAFKDGAYLEVIKEVKLLGVIVDDKLGWNANSDYICKKAMSKLWLLRNMKKSGLTKTQLIDAYVKEVRSLLELAVPVWYSSISKIQSQKIETVQKAALAHMTYNLKKC